ncbi:hypothetical protein CHS0354_032161 [Potamilus streckersoni]|uniref:Uncharacterized protein n=1 Tax=Potamilus streckersoni TaxID=2493646 RepID=A0AAE0THL4_9BIVA|nr:hypothetical protein CHS0354_032161 [Potamilus streckersoni]
MNNTTVSSPTNANTTTTTYVPTTPFFSTTTSVGLFDSPEGRAILGLLVVIIVILVALPLLFYILARKCCLIKMTPSGQSQLSHGIPSTTGKNKKIQTDVTGKDVEELFRKRQPTNVLEYKGKVIENQEMPARIKPVNPNTWNDPWSSKFPRDHHYITRLED